MDKKIDRLRRQQQRLWRKAAVSILSLHHNIAILMAFMMIAVLGIFWMLVDQKLESQLSLTARSYGYAISHYAADDLQNILGTEDKLAQQAYLQRITSDPFISSASLFDHLGSLLAMSSSTNAIISPDDNHLQRSDVSKNSRPNNLILLEDIFDNQQRLGIIQIEIDRKLLEAPLRKTLNNLAIIAVIMMLLSTILSWAMSKRLTKSLRKLLKFPIDSPEDKVIKNLDVGSELKLMLQSSTNPSDSPAPVSRAEESGIHQLLAVDSNAHSGKVVILKLQLPELSSWLKSESGTHNVHLLRKLDRLLIMTVHSQQGHLLHFDGLTAQACFGLDGKLDSAVYRSVSCCLLLEKLLADLSLFPNISLREEQRLLIRHMKRTPVAIPTDVFEGDNELKDKSQRPWLLLHNNICRDSRLLDQIQLIEVTKNWQSIDELSLAAKSMIERQLTWIRYLLAD